MPNDVRTGWFSRLTRLAVGGLVFLIASGLVVTFAPFHAAVEWSVLLHTLAGLLVLAPLVWYTVAHWLDYKSYRFSDVVLLGYLAGVALLVCLVSGLVVTWQGLFGLRMSPLWRNVHLYSTFVVLAVGLVHGVLVWVRVRRTEVKPFAGGVVTAGVVWLVVGALAVAALTALYAGPSYDNRFPDDYSYLYGEDRPFAPSLAVTASGGAYQAESLPAR